MSRRIDTPQETPRNDALLNRYQEANAHDPLRPHPDLRETVLNHANTHRATTEALLHTPPHRRLAANDGLWKIRALGSLAVLGLVGLLVMQFEHGTPEEQATALGAPSFRDSPGSTPPLSKEATTVAATPPPLIADVDSLEPPNAKARSKITPGARSAFKAAPSPQASVSRSVPPPPVPAASPETPAGGLGAVAEAQPFARVPTPSHAEQPAAVDSTNNTIASAAAPAPTTRANVAESITDGAPTGRALADTARSRATAASSLRAAATRGDLESANRLIQQGVDVNAQDPAGRTALMFAAEGKSQAVLTALLTAGANKLLTDHSGRTAAAYAERADNRDWLPLLRP